MERRPVRHAGRPERGELLAQHRDDLLAEDVHLLEDGLEREAGVIGQEELALVVADDLTEPKRSVDDLLRAADRHRRLGHVVLERHAAAVDGSVVEVRTEFADRVLASSGA